MKIYVGVDQALRKIGLCVLQDDQPVVLRLIQPPPDLQGPERLSFLKNTLLTAIMPYKEHIQAAAYEGQSLGSPGDIDQLGNIGGDVAVLLNNDLEIPCARIYKVPRATLKKFITGKANASKDLMRCVLVALSGAMTSHKTTYVTHTGSHALLESVRNSYQPNDTRWKRPIHSCRKRNVARLSRSCFQKRFKTPGREGA